MMDEARGRCPLGPPPKELRPFGIPRAALQRVCKARPATAPLNELGELGELGEAGESGERGEAGERGESPPRCLVSAEVSGEQERVRACRRAAWPCIIRKAP